MSEQKLKQQLKQQHRIFVSQMAIHGDAVKAYQQAYPKTVNRPASASNGAWRLMKRPEIAEQIVAESEAIAKGLQLLQEQITREKLETMEGMRELIHAIVKGDITNDKAYKCSNRIEKVSLKANVREILYAIKVNLKLFDLPDGLKPAKPNRYNVFIGNRRFV